MGVMGPLRALALAVLVVSHSCSMASPEGDNLQTELGMAHREVDQRDKGQDEEIRAKRGGEQSEDDRQMVTIDLSALRPSLPGLVLYQYGDLAPKLVQVDLDALNPQLQPHVIWPQFHHQMGGGASQVPFDFGSENMDASIPYLGEEDSLTPNPQRNAKMTNEDDKWPDFNELNGADIYDFLPDSVRNEELMILHQSLPVADEVIVPLDWEEKKEVGSSRMKASKRNVFVSQGWKPGGQAHQPRGGHFSGSASRTSPRGETPEGVHYTALFGSNGWRPGRKKDQEGIERESEVTPEKKNVFLSKGWGPGGRPLDHETQGASGRVGDRRLPSQESWAVPRTQWSVPQLFGTDW